MPLIHTAKGFVSACTEGKEAVARKYISWSGAATWAGARDAENNTGLHGAARSGLFQIAADLIKAGADVNARNNDGTTPLMMAVSYANTEIVKSLLDAGADPNIADKQGSRPIDAAASGGNAVIMKLLLDAKAEIDTPNKPLLRAVEYGRNETAILLLDAGAKPDEQRGNYCLPLHYAARGAAVDVMKKLLEKGADINARDYQGATALHWATENNSVLAIEFLLSKGALTSIENVSGQTALQRAKERQYDQPVRLLEAAAGKTPQVPVHPVSAPAPAPAAPASSDSETWTLMGQDKAVHVGIYPTLNRKITEVFNFTSRERLIIAENLKTGAETITQPEKFDTLAQDVIQRAEEQLKALGGAPGGQQKRSFNL